MEKEKVEITWKRVKDPETGKFKIIWDRDNVQESFKRTSYIEAPVEVDWEEIDLDIEEDAFAMDHDAEREKVIKRQSVESMDAD